MTINEILIDIKENGATNDALKELITSFKTLDLKKDLAIFKKYYDLEEYELHFFLKAYNFRKLSMNEQTFYKCILINCEISQIIDEKVPTYTIDELVNAIYLSLSTALFTQKSTVYIGNNTKASDELLFLKFTKEINELYFSNKDKYYRLAVNHPVYQHELFNICSPFVSIMGRRFLGILLDLDNAITSSRLKKILKNSFKTIYNRSYHTSKIASGTDLSGKTGSVALSMSVLNALISWVSGNKIVFATSTIYKHGIHLCTIYLNDNKKYSLDYFASHQDDIRLFKDNKKFDYCKKYLKTIIKNNSNRIPYSLYQIFHVASDLMNPFLLIMNDVEDEFDEYQNQITTTFIEFCFRNDIDVQDLDELSTLCIISIINEMHQLIISDYYASCLLKDELNVSTVNIQQKQFQDRLKSLENENKQLKERLVSYNDKEKDEIEKLKQEHNKEIIRITRDKDAVINKQRDLINELAANKSELHNLREFIFSLSNDTVEAIDEDIDNIDLTDSIKDKKIICIGGHISLTRKLKTLYPMITFVSKELINNNSVLNNADYIFFITAWMNHIEYDIAMRYIDKHDCPFGYLEGENVKRVQLQMMNYLKKN
ncbi:hypothetical protein MKA27_17760 [[Clostridium] innocuum]|uniref:hypothetical protein n=1 Tax=Clostridium innocuum TaxID=1522 RepID=UPI000D6AF3D2|nr:hypothetical protein [[Clostridium] innocuum]MCR0316364.1 hypothetical protein [[Clostridium] innocuum]MCR0370909.1 hypothetical protein [[Clostridium] innocuum]MCR0375637.1 hypothetical protein [[Clostridium] innocuum]MCR0603659.1 hypothetical protein [[Clostridium] innocuum]PWJ12059.1 hypothetical protein ATF84_115107 [[Clostridium] innocuum]